MSQQKLTLFAIGVFMLFSAKISAQVTIGSSEKPISGALLQVKEDGAYTNDANANRGIGMPRVALNTVDKLYPMLSSGYDTSENSIHEGLSVYNITNGNGFCPGMYIWDGSEWKALNSASKPDIKVTDVDGNVYTARWFSTVPCDPNASGKYWFTSNLRVTRLPDGSSLGLNSPFSDYTVLLASKDVYEIRTLSDLQNGTISYGEDANQILANNKTISRSEYADKFGLLYYWAQAKEICPIGWHLPDYTEWDALLNYFGGAATAGASMRANNNYYYNNQNGVDGSVKWGSSDPANVEPLGFNAYPTGWTNSAGISGIINFGKSTLWWTTDNAGQSMTYVMDYFTPSISTRSNYEGDFVSVRCVQD